MIGWKFVASDLWPWSWYSEQWKHLKLWHGRCLSIVLFFETLWTRSNFHFPINVVLFKFPVHHRVTSRVYQTGDRHLKSLKNQTSESTVGSFCSNEALGFQNCLLFGPDDLFVLFAVVQFWKILLLGVRWTLPSTLSTTSMIKFWFIIMEWIGVRISTWNDTVWMQRKHDRFLIRI